MAYDEMETLGMGKNYIHLFSGVYPKVLPGEIFRRHTESNKAIGWRILV